MILAIGYRVRSNVGIHFRNWTSNILEEYSRKGFSMNDERLKNPKPFGEDYFLKQYKTKFIMEYMDILPQKSLCREQMLQKIIWA